AGRLHAPARARRPRGRQPRRTVPCTAPRTSGRRPPRARSTSRDDGAGPTGAAPVAPWCPRRAHGERGSNTRYPDVVGVLAPGHRCPGADLVGTMPEAVVVVPCFNEERRLRDDDFLALAGEPGFRLLFVDDGSTDGTFSRLESLRGRADGRVELLRLAT